MKSQIAARNSKQLVQETFIKKTAWCSFYLYCGYGLGVKKFSFVAQSPFDWINSITSFDWISIFTHFYQVSHDAVQIPSVSVVEPLMVRATWSNGGACGRCCQAAPLPCCCIAAGCMALWLRLCISFSVSSVQMPFAAPKYWLIYHLVSCIPNKN